IILLCVKLQGVIPSRPYPFGRHRFKAEDKLLEPEIGLQPGNLFGIFTDDVAVKVGIYRCHDHKSRIFR
ncbi:MAG: hypothetical protein M3512_15195, partial [Bacteroidota bacterium]|nr:hypothetical protein [Bacteroidota bacterium]